MKVRIFSLLILMILVVSTAGVSAITAEVEKGGAVVRAEIGDTIERSIIVSNAKNDVSVDIEITASGDMKNKVVLDEDKFELAPGEKKEVFFTIKVNQEGLSKTDLNVKFIPAGEKSGAVITAWVKVIGGENSSSETESAITGAVIGKNMNAATLVLVAMTGVILLAFILLMAVFYSRKKRKQKKELNPKRAVKSLE